MANIKVMSDLMTGEAYTRAAAQWYPLEGILWLLCFVAGVFALVLYKSLNSTGKK